MQFDVVSFDFLPTSERTSTVLTVSDFLKPARYPAIRTSGLALKAT